MLNECVFCKICKDSASTALWEYKNWLVIKDKYPSAKIHYLIMYKEHVPKLEHVPSYELQQCMNIVKRLSIHLNIDDFNLKLNNGPVSGQSIPHLHFHYLSNL